MNKDTLNLLCACYFADLRRNGKRNTLELMHGFSDQATQNACKDDLQFIRDNCDNDDELIDRAVISTMAKLVNTYISSISN
jgi:hypothetical protein